MSFALDVPSGEFDKANIRGFLQYAPDSTAAFLHRSGGGPSKYIAEEPAGYSISHVGQQMNCKFLATHWWNPVQVTKPMEAGADGQCLTSGLDVPALPASCYAAGLDPDNDLAVFALAPGAPLLKVQEAHNAAFKLFLQRRGEGGGF